MLLEQEGYIYSQPKRDVATKQDQRAKEQATALLEELKRGQNR
jgi:hypothetical protein